MSGHRMTNLMFRHGRGCRWPGIADGSHRDPGTRRDHQGRTARYVIDRSPKCVLAIENLQHTCGQHLAGRHQIEVVDLQENPRRSADDQILAVPTLVRKLPQDRRRPTRHRPAFCRPKASAANRRGQVTDAMPSFAGRSRSMSPARHHLGRVYRAPR